MNEISTFSAATLRVGVERGYVLDGALGKVGNLTFREADGGTPPSRRPNFCARVAVVLSALKRVIFSTGERREIMRKEGAVIYNQKLCQKCLGKLTADMSKADNVASVRKTLDRMRTRASADHGDHAKWTAILKEAISHTSPRDREAIMTGVVHLRKQSGGLKNSNSQRQYLNAIENLLIARQLGAELVKPQAKKSVRFDDTVQTMEIPSRAAQAAESDGRHAVARRDE